MATGRKSAYDTVIQPKLKQIETWLIDDQMTHKEICKKLNINPDTFYKYIKLKTELSDIIKKAKQQMNEDIEAEYIKTAIYGKYVYEETIEYVYNELGEEKIVRKTVNKRYIKPDSAQGIFTMKNRLGWTDKQEISFNDVEDDPVTIAIKKGIKK